MTSHLRAEGLWKCYASSQCILKNLSVEFRGPCVVGIVGDNGSGKTTLVDVLSGFKQATKGKVWVGEQDLTSCHPPVRVAAGIVRSFQEVRVFPRLTVAENVIIGREIVETAADGRFYRMAKLLSGGRDISGKRWHPAYEATIRRFGLKALEDHQASQLSYGQQKLVELCRISLCENQVVLLDEPVAGLAAEAQGSIVEQIREWRNNNRVVVIVEHERRILEEETDRLFRLTEGRLVEIK